MVLKRNYLQMRRHRWHLPACVSLPLVSAGLATLVAMGGFIAPAHANLILNGSFETGNFADWAKSGANLVYVVSATGTTGGVPYGPENGTYYAQFDAYVGSPATISQSIATTIGTSYDFSFWVSSVGGTPNSLAANFGSVNVLTITNEPNTAYVEYNYAVTATSNLTTISFSGSDNPLWMMVDNISVVAAAPVSAPEPAGMAIFGACLLSMVAIYRRRHAA